MKAKRKKSPVIRAGRANDQTILSHSLGVVSRRSRDGSVAILRLDNDRYIFQADKMAADFWDLIDGKASVGKIAARLQLSHSPPVRPFRQGIDRFIAALFRERLVEIRGRGSRRVP